MKLSASDAKTSFHHSARHLMNLSFIALIRSSNALTPSGPTYMTHQCPFPYRVLDSNLPKWNSSDFYMTRGTFQTEDVWVWLELKSLR
ncbi:hypothetical protein HUJ04_010526 [Dendroctonus ponderosae]|nr:hypothetical protein HUJ04_010526 [Dendroctonus ponderosae]